MKKYLLLICTVMAVCLLPASVHAHVLISDDTKKVGAVLHLTPDDDPIAGEPSELFFDIQSNEVSQQTHSFTLKVVAGDGGEAFVPIQVAGSTVSARFAFPSQGAYTISLHAEPLAIGGRTLQFSHPQRVSRGLVASTQATPSHLWAEVSLIASLCGLLVLGIITYNNRRSLAVYIRSQK